jgi:hypothetical protein
MLPGDDNILGTDDDVPLEQVPTYYARDQYVNFVAVEPGLYPVRFLWFQSSHRKEPGMTLELYSVKDRAKHLLNDTKDPKAIKAYYEIVTPPEVITSVYEAPEGGWAYSMDVGDISSWSHNNGSDQWDGSPIGGEFGDGNRPGGVSLLGTYVRLQDTGDPRDYGYSDSGSNRKIYLGQDLSGKGVSNTILDDGATLHFIARIPTNGPLDPLHPDGGGGVQDYPAGGDGYENHDGGKGNIGIKQGAGGNISFSLNEAGKVIITEDGTELELSTTEWHEFWVTTQKSDGGHTVSVYLDGSTEANVFTVTAGSGSDFDGSYLAMGVGSTGRSGALDVAAFNFSPGVIAPGGGADTTPPTLSIVNNGDGTVTVTFEGTLQAAASVNGPWADVNASSPLTVTANEAQQYARAVRK